MFRLWFNGSKTDNQTFMLNWPTNTISDSPHKQDYLWKCMQYIKRSAWHHWWYSKNPFSEILRNVTDMVIKRFKNHKMAELWKLAITSAVPNISVYTDHFLRLVFCPKPGIVKYICKLLMGGIRKKSRIKEHHDFFRCCEGIFYHSKYKNISQPRQIALNPRSERLYVILNVRNVSLHRKRGEV